MAPRGGLYYDAPQSSTSLPTQEIPCRVQPLRTKAPPCSARSSCFREGTRRRRALYAAAKLKIADLLAAGPQPVAELARELPGERRRAVPHVAGAGVDGRVPGKGGRERSPNSPLSEAIRSDLPGSARDAVLFMGDSLHMEIYGELTYTLETGAARRSRRSRACSRSNSSSKRTRKKTAYSTPR